MKAPFKVYCVNTKGLGDSLTVGSWYTVNKIATQHSSWLTQQTYWYIYYKNEKGERENGGFLPWRFLTETQYKRKNGKISKII